MREIKFRAWNGIEIIGMDDLCFIHCGSYTSMLLDIFRGDKPSVKLMQYTGLKDAKGVDIYEGDIVKGFSDVDEYNFEIIFAVDRYSNGWEVSSWDVEKGAEVIGNIHQNPELLEES
jgi:uncharacterized phage protein (TIGR01671 family)